MRRVLLALTIALTTATLVGTATVSAQAANGQVNDLYGTKAVWTYNESTNKLCLQTLTGGRTSTHLIVNPGSIQRTATSARVATASDFQTTGQFDDGGGDAAPTCVRLPARYDGRTTTVRLTWFGSGDGRVSGPFDQFVA